ncbi:TRAP transporter substrate-binding protein [Aureimonas phyllosphaerae]|uniref:TRAP-type mannitol/chloroaromatic compound transport system substrate-binding protein n=1 Tax=Aureimonas phyllosphaerae TaxID=1166078 RepID=A0A7W6FT78_9HYPH|nr:TRAP transporter substrate-binding protein [Aureimonas phyllosphaerae]MBB3934743.1 TRAP-type mannitol/chloroaromatic compound transport system substrate-binding protein [Aureimonas phyllosphaerae]MBB3958042.1 TRAP-type mannitol/chloroaromatic compound transport system substrate-binding protein [Aureimonas phyllosphaerae]SFE90832.1 TRAP-type mannitol/chloroaromatic compound transport system, substrate-binding protein [Aureimonas phyllosphaerae]
MDRRQFIRQAGVVAGGAVAGTGLAAPAIAQEAPTLRWRMTSSFPNTLDTLFGSSRLFSEIVSKLTDGKFTIDVFPAGELVPGLQALDATQDGTVEAAHTVLYYYVGKDPTFAIGSSIPFGLNARQQNAWLYNGGGNEAINEFLTSYGVRAYPGGNTGTQMGGWFRKEINSLNDLQGLKMRIAGIAGQVLAPLGVVAQQLAGGDVYPALERGTLDATEFVGPYDDEKLGFYQVAPYYYYPAFWEAGPTVHYMFNQAKYDELPDSYKAALENAAAVCNTRMLADYDVKNMRAIRSLVGKGVQLRPLPRDVLDAALASSQDLYAKLSASNPKWKAMYDPWSQFRTQIYEWFRVAEYTNDTYNYSQQAAGK